MMALRNVLLAVSMQTMLDNAAVDGKDNDVVDETKHIFGTDAMKAWFEQKARQNLLEEIHMLERGVIPCEEMSGH